ncbi:HNH endonuclease, partial [Avibacterium gallinarum]|uniref:HNH endonuclease n=1 Tax=Avibacterium gallinarum TaxID=755 RepID=UPI0039FC6CF9
AAAAKGNITAGALAASASELAAPAITKALGKDSPNQLSAEERQTVTALSALAGSLASGLTAQQNGSATNTVSTLNAAALGGEIGRRAVENNFFDYSLQDIEAMAINAKASELKEEINEKVIENFEKEHPELVEHLRKTGDIASFLADLTPGIGDVKSFAEAEDGIDYLLATIGIIPGSDIVTKPLKGAKQAFKKAKEAEKLGHSKDIIKYQKEATRYINNSVNGFYDSKEYRELLTRKYGGNVKSTTVPPSNAKNVNLAGKRHPITGVPFDNKGFPIFDKYTTYDTRLDISSFRNKAYIEQMSMATRDLANAIEKGYISKNNFTSEQLNAIYRGDKKIPGFTWHHHQDTGRMQLIPERIHQETGHIGGRSIQQGK